MDATQECHSMNISKNGTIIIKEEISSDYEHRYVSSLASYRGSPFVTGGSGSPGGNPDHSKTELLDIKKMKWEAKADFPSKRYFISYLYSIFLKNKI